jgi:UrcA family protein
MLNKRKIHIHSAARKVKKLGMALPLLAGLCAVSMAPLAQANESLMTERVLTVKISVAELKTENGAQTVYSKLDKRANRECKADRQTLKYLGQTKDECVDDLMDQFIESANVETLATYHLSQKPGAAPEKVALNTP